MEQKELFTASPTISSQRVIYTPSEFARKGLLHLQEIGSLKAQAPYVSKFFELPSYLCFAVLEGAGRLLYGKKEYELHEGDVVFIDCRVKYAHMTKTDLWTLQWCHFYGPQMSVFYDKYAERGGKPTFHPESIERFAGLFSELQEISKKKDYIRDVRINEKLSALLTLLMEQSWSSERRRTSKKQMELQDVKDYLDSHYNQKLTLDSLASEFYINKYYLTRIFKEQYGVTISAYLLQLRVTAAKHLLRFTDKTIEEIGIECGMNDANYFSRMFRKVEGISPSEYRKRW